MKTGKLSSTLRTVVAWRAGIILLLLAAAAPFASVAATPIPAVSIRGEVYSNVVVRQSSVSSVTLSHSRGMMTLSPAKLTRTELEDLGLVEKPAPKPQPAENPVDLNLTQPASRVVYDTRTVIDRLREGKNGAGFDFKQILPLLENAHFPVLVFAIPVVLYLFLCLCFMLICKKAGKPSALTWVPIVQMLPLYRAANMSPIWFLLMLLQLLLYGVLITMMCRQTVQPAVLMGSGIGMGVLGVIHTIGWIVWGFKIAIARGKSPILGVALLLPVVNVLAFLYLAFSSGDGVPAAPSPAAVRKPILAS